MIRKLLVGPSLSLALAGCADLVEPLGDCTDPAKGRRPVLSNGQVMYAGQAIMVRSCANGLCHTGSTTGEARYGVPAGLDFDVLPAAAVGPVRADGTVEPDPEQLKRVRAHQRKIFDNRTSLWDQVSKGLMPPGGVGEPLRQAKVGAFVSAGGTCPTGAELGPITEAQTKEELRQWLACGAPVVEVNAVDLPAPIGGTVGDQFPSCGGGETLDPTFENVFEHVFMASCVTGCHEPNGAWSTFDLSSPEVAYETLLGEGAAGAPSNCGSNDNPMVTPSDPAASYLIAKVGGTGAGERCDTAMPLGTLGLPTRQLDLLQAWIADGAPGPGDAAGGGDAGL